MILGTFLPWISVSFTGHVSLWGITEYLRMLASLGFYGPRGGGGATLIIYLFLLPFYLIPVFAARLIYKEARGSATPGSRRRVGLYGLLAPWVMVLLAYIIVAGALNPRGSPGGVGNPLAILSVVGQGWYLVMGCGIALILIASASPPQPYFVPDEQLLPVPSQAEIQAPAPVEEPKGGPDQASVADPATEAVIADDRADEAPSPNRAVAIMAAVAVLVIVTVGIIIVSSRRSAPDLRNSVASADPGMVAPVDNGTVMASAPLFTVTSSSIDATPAFGGPATVTEMFYFSGAVAGSGYSCGLGSAPQQAGTLPTESGWVSCTWRDVPPGQYVGFLTTNGVTTSTRDLMIPAGSPPQAAAPAALEPQAQQFAARYFATWSGSDSEALAFLENAYPANINFYGREVASATVMRDKRAFVARWPERNYVIDPATLSVACNASTRRCTVSGNVTFRCHNQLRNETSSGVASFSFELLFPDNGRSLILVESSQLISRVRS